jgi:CheY-like chemotaxis protein
MKDMVKWLREVEHLACEFYLRAATYFADDPRLNKFLMKTAEEESWHYHVMGSAAEYMLSMPDFVPAISIDKEMDDKIINFFADIKTGFENKTVSEKDLIEKIAELELSEWNDVFLYTVNTLKDESSEFFFPAEGIQAHIKRIEHFIESFEYGPAVLKKMAELRPVWVADILIVDDEEALADLLMAILNRMGNIDIANNGEEALKLLEKKDYKLILSDIDMPVMDGMTFFQEAVARDPEVKSRFLFMTGRLSPDRQAFFDEKNVKCLEKPIGMKVLRDEASKIILQ